MGCCFPTKTHCPSTIETNRKSAQLIRNQILSKNKDSPIWKDQLLKTDISYK